jgi:hypothetical protein
MQNAPPRGGPLLAQSGPSEGGRALPLCLYLHTSASPRNVARNAPREELLSQPLRIRGGSERWLTNGSSRARLTITAIAL